MKKQPAARRYKLLRNILLIVLVLLVFWFLLGAPALTKTQAFRRAMREHFLQPQDPEVFFGEDGRISALAKVGDIYVQTGLGKDRMMWDHAFWSETEAVDGVYIVPLYSCGINIDGPEVAVLAEGERAELTFSAEGEELELIGYGRQDGWFLFQFDVKIARDKAPSIYSHYLSGNTYMQIGSPAMHMGPCSFVFVSYDAEGREVVRTEKNY